MEFGQHAYVKGKSVDSALYEVVRTIKSFLEKQEFSLATFIGMECEFNSASRAALISVIASLSINQNLLAWLSHMLRNRQAILV